mgnify:CR=1 FL=1
MNESAIKADVAASALRGLAAAGYFSPEQLSAMEGILYGKNAPSNPGRQWFSIAEACKYSRLSRTFLWKHYQLGHLVMHKIGHRRLVERGELDAFILSAASSIDVRTRCRG